jgi:hypothetical protein
VNAEMDVIIVRRGCRERFEQLRQVFSEEDVTVLWDRREGDRRRRQTAVALDRRVRDRRRPPPRSWTALDFIVIPDRSANGAADRTGTAT